MRNPAINASYKKSHPEQVRESNRRYYESHREQCAEKRRLYYDAHREEAAVRAAANYEANREEYKARNSAWRAAHQSPAQREELREYNKAYAVEHREELAAASHIYYTNHRPEYRAWRQGYKARLRNATGTHSADDVSAQYDRQKGRCFYCREKVGSTYHADHVIPLAGSRTSSNGPENIVISCPLCNLSKHCKDPMDFAGIMF